MQAAWSACPLGTPTVGVTFTHPFRLPQGPLLVSSSPSTALTPQFLSFPPIPPPSILFSLTAPGLLSGSPCQGCGTGPDVPHTSHQDEMDPGAGERADLSARAHSPHSSHHPNPSGLQEETGNRGLKKQLLEISGVRKGGGRGACSSTQPSTTAPAPRFSPWPPSLPSSWH